MLNIPKIEKELNLTVGDKITFGKWVLNVCNTKTGKTKVYKISEKVARVLVKAGIPMEG